MFRVICCGRNENVLEVTSFKIDCHKGKEKSHTFKNERILLERGCLSLKRLGCKKQRSIWVQRTGHSWGCRGCWENQLASHWPPVALVCPLASALSACLIHLLSSQSALLAPICAPMELRLASVWQCQVPAPDLSST